MIIYEASVNFGSGFCSVNAEQLNDDLSALVRALEDAENVKLPPVCDGFITYWHIPDDWQTRHPQTRLHFYAYPPGGGSEPEDWRHCCSLAAAKAGLQLGLTKVSEVYDITGGTKKGEWELIERASKA
jgi:hypothetical protein